MTSSYTESEKVIISNDDDDDEMKGLDRVCMKGKNKEKRKRKRKTKNKERKLSESPMDNDRGFHPDSPVRNVEPLNENKLSEAPMMKRNTFFDPDSARLIPWTSNEIPSGRMVRRFPWKPRPIQDTPLRYMLCSFSKLAIKRYNRKNHTNYKFVKYLEATETIAADCNYFVTFKAKKPSDHALTTFQATVQKRLQRKPELVDYFLVGQNPRY